MSDEQKKIRLMIAALMSIDRNMEYLLSTFQMDLGVDNSIIEQVGRLSYSEKLNLVRNLSTDLLKTANITTIGGINVSV